MPEADRTTVFNAFREYDAHRYVGGTLAEQEAYVARFEQLAERYPLFTLDFIRQQLRENPYQQKVKVILASDQSERKKKAALEVAFAQQRDVQKGIIGCSAALKSACTIIDLAASGNLAVLKVALELLPQGSDGRWVLQERGPQGLKRLFEALARQRPAEEVAATRQAVSASIEAIRLQDHPERNAPLKRSLAELP